MSPVARSAQGLPVSSFRWYSLCHLISFHPLRSTRSSDVVTIARPPSYSSLKVNNRAFRHASPRLRNELPEELRQPADRPKKAN